MALVAPGFRHKYLQEWQDISITMQKKVWNITSRKFLSKPEYTKDYMLLANDWL
jgi:hypothetical protein